MKRVLKVLVLLFFCLNLHYVNAQTYREVGCMAPFETWTLGLYKNKLVYSGFHYANCGGIGEFLWAWDSTSWKKLGITKVRQQVPPPKVVLQVGNDLFIGGGFKYIDSTLEVNRIARWDGSQWHPLGLGINSPTSFEITALCYYKGELYAGGIIREINGSPGYNNIARWDGTTWRKVGTGVQGSIFSQVYNMQVYHGDLYVGGYFFTAGGKDAYNIARWDGQNWYPVDTGTNGIVYTLLVDTVSDLLYVGGEFNFVKNTLPADYIASWNGNKWSALGNKRIFNLDVLTLQMYHGYLFAGGLSRHGLITDTCLARWDGNNWTPFTGFNSNVSSLQTYKDELYIGGLFRRIGADSISYLARYYSADSVVQGIGGSKKNTNLNIYPNPAEDFIQIESTFEISTLSIIEMFGTVLYEKKRPIEKTLSIKELQPGIYILKMIDTQQHVYVQRVIKR